MNLRLQASSAAAGRLRELKGPAIFRETPEGYTKKPEQNLIPGIDREDFWDDLASGDGSELQDTETRPAKFCAAYSSSALAVNSFGPFRRTSARLSLAGFSGFEDARFEAKCPTGLQGNVPNLDFLASDPGAVVGVESKFLEPLAGKPADFPQSYDSLVEREADHVWRGVYERLRDSPDHFKHIDAAQLVKHYLGLRHTHGTTKQIVLMYCYWEPQNVSDHPELGAHQRETTEFAEWVAGGDIGFEALSYPDLWAQWEIQSNWPGIVHHVAMLRERYSFAV